MMPNDTGKNPHQVKQKATKRCHLLYCYHSPLTSSVYFSKEAPTLPPCPQQTLSKIHTLTQSVSLITPVKVVL